MIRINLKERIAMEYEIKHRGMFGVKIYTLTKQGDKGEEYREYHESNLADDIRSLLEAHGYIVEDIFLDFKEEESCTKSDVINFKKYKFEGERKAKHLYSKVNNERFIID